MSLILQTRCGINLAVYGQGEKNGKVINRANTTI